MMDLHGFVRQRALFFIFAGGFVLSFGLALWTGWNEWVANQQQLHQAAHWTGSAGYLWSFALVISSNISSNLLGQSLVIILTAYFIYRHSAESRDVEDRVEQLVERVHDQIAGKNASDGDTEQRHGFARIWHGYSLGILFVLLCLAFMGIQTWTGWIDYVGTSPPHQPASFGEYLISSWGYNTWQNWQADLVGPAIQLVLARHFIFKGSSQSKDSDERMKKLLKETLKHLNQQPARGTQETAPAG